MSKSKPVTITVEEAVAAMVNMDYIPDGLSATDMTEAFLDVAEVEYENARIDHLPDDEISRLKDRFDVCSARHSLALILRDELQWEVDHHESSRITMTTGTTTGVMTLEFESLFDWAYDRYGICIPAPAKAEHIRWEKVTIKIYKDWRIGFLLGNKQHKISSFQDIGLIGKRKLIPNQPGLILIALSKGGKFPKGKNPSAADTTAMSKLRRSLERLTGITADPFVKVNVGDGWKPRFKLVDDTRNADERAKAEAKHVQFVETRDYDDEDESKDDDASKWLKANDN